jgi:hypothetical protein
MRGVRTFLILLLLLAGLGSYVYFVESKRDPSSSSDKDKVFSVEADKIDEITVKAESGERTTLRKKGTEWQIAEPQAPGMSTQPDGAEVSGLTTNISNVEVQRVIDENPGDLTEYGLAQPRLEVTFKENGKSHTLQIGRKSPTNTDLYAKLSDQKRVFLIPSYLDGTFNKTTFALRDKTVLKIDREKIDAFGVTSPKQTLHFVKAGNEWQMTTPVKTRADFTAVDSLVSRVHTLQMKSLAAAEGGALAEYGLDKPQATLQLGTGSSQAVLLLGKSAGEGAIYAKDQSRPAVFTVDSTLVTDATKDPGEFRQKDLFDARPFNSTRIDVARGAETISFEKTKVKNKEGQDEEKWRQVAPSAKDVDQTKMDNLVSAVTGARATGFAESAAKTGLDKPEITITVKSDDGKREEKVAMARSGSDGFALRTGEPGAATVDIATIENIVKAVDALK